MPAVNKKLRSALRVEFHDAPPAPAAAAPTIMLGDCLNKIEAFAALRNIMGCHFNEVAFHLKDASGIEFGRMVLEFADALLHPEHGWPASDKSGEYWSNGKRTRRMFPLRQPS